MIVALSFSYTFHLSEGLIKLGTNVLHTRCWNAKSDSLMAMINLKPILEEAVASDVGKIILALLGGIQVILITGTESRLACVYRTPGSHTF
jgi:hypothetical protein